MSKTSTSRCYDFHGLLTVDLECESPGYLAYLDHQLGFFKAEAGGEPDVAVRIGPVERPQSANGKRVVKYHVERDHLCWQNRYKISTWWVSVDGLEGGPIKVAFDGDRFAPKYLFMHLLEPLINYRLAERDAMLLHSSGVGNRQRGYVFSAMMGTGKTSLMVYLMKQGLPQFLADDFSIVSGDGHLYSYPTPLSLFDYNVRANGFLSQNLTLGERWRIRRNGLLYKASMSTVKPVVPVEVARIFPEAEIPQKLPLGALSLLVSTESRDLQVRPVEDLDALVEKLLIITRFEFRFFREALESYAYIYPSSPVAAYEERYRGVLRRLVKSVPCFEIEIPRGFRFEGEHLNRELDKVLACNG